jgi:hypothetical protein
VNDTRIGNSTARAIVSPIARELSHDVDILKADSGQRRVLADLRLSGYGQSVMNVARAQSEQDLEVRERGRPSVIRMTAPGPKLMHWDRPISSSRMRYATSFASMRTRSDLTALTKAAWSCSV